MASNTGPPSPSSSKVKYARKLTKTKLDDETPGNPRYLDSFLNVGNKEGILAAYCGYNDKGAFRVFALSPWCLTFYNQILDIRPQMWYRPFVLSLLKDAPYEFVSDDSLASVYPQDGDKARYWFNYRVALAAAQMLRALEKKNAFVQEDAESARAGLQERINIPVPAITIKDVQLKGFGPFEYLGEAPLEAYNRCLNVFSYLSSSRPATVWNARFRSKGWAEPVYLREEYVPRWMRQAVVVTASNSNDMQPTSPPARPAHHPIFVEVEWMAQSKDPAAKEYVAYHEEKQLATGRLKHTIAIYPYMTEARVRDLLRSTLEFDEKQAQLSMAQLTISYETKGTEIFELVGMQERDWEKAKEALWGPQKLTNVVCLVLARLRDDGEEFWDD